MRRPTTQHGRRSATREHAAPPPACSSFANAILGGAGCTFLIGILSDWWAPALGKDSLRYALTAGMSFCLVAGALFMYAARLAVAEWKPAGDAA